MVAALAAAVLAAGCDAGFEDKAIVIDLRVLGAVAEPPELVLDFDPEDLGALAIQLEQNPVTVTALVADPGAARGLEWDMSVCAPTSSLRCDEPEDTVVTIASGSVPDPESAGPVAMMPSAAMVVPLPVLEESLTADSLAGFGGVAVQVQIRVWPEGAAASGAETVYAAKRVVVAPRVPAERVANSNPWILDLHSTTDPQSTPDQLVLPGACGVTGTTPAGVSPGGTLRLLPIEPVEVRETYVLPTFDGDVRTITEYMRYAWFATAGSFDRGDSGGATDAFGNVPTLDVVWTAPDEPGEVRLWLVQRDERGGASWRDYCILVQ
jgi:hypothetical protein